MRRGLGQLAAAGCLLLVLATPAQAAKSCPEPGTAWERATPAEAGMDAAKLQAALDYGTENAGFAVRVYRNGCLVGEDRNAANNRNAQFESWSLAKSITAMIFGRAMTLGLIQPDDVVGGLFPEADAPHGEITMRDLLTMSSGLFWNGFRDYNIFTMPDRIRDALTLERVREPGTYFEYAQSAVSLLAEAIGRSAGADTQEFAQAELMDPLGIPANGWRWTRDRAGHIGGFYGVNMRPDDFGRLGELMRRGGIWKGRRLLSRRFMRNALAPSATNGCYGWLIWVNSGKPCIGPRVANRSVDPDRNYAGLPAEMYRFSGLFGQLTTVFPNQDLVVVRVGQDPGVAPTGGQSWESGLYERVLDALSDGTNVERTKPEPGAIPAGADDDVDRGFHTALSEPGQYSQGAVQAPLPPAGPARARALWMRLAVPRASRRSLVFVRATCPPRWPTDVSGKRCRGAATLTGARAPLAYDLAAGETRILKFKLTKKAVRDLRAAGRAVLDASARNTDAAGGTVTEVPLRVAKALRAKRRG